jgi:hypothetical protein
VVNANRAVRFWVCAQPWKRQPATLFQLPGLAVLGRVTADGLGLWLCNTLARIKHHMQIKLTMQQASTDKQEVGIS